MIRSMTGYGKATVSSPYGNVTAEIKTLNHKGFSVICAPFDDFFLLEDRVKDLFNNKVYRGKVYVKIIRESTAKQKPVREMILNEDLAKEYLRRMRSFQKKLSLGGELGVKDMISLPGVVEYSAGGEEEKLWPHIKKATRRAIGKLLVYRAYEGKRLAKDTGDRIKKIKKSLVEVKKFAKKGVDEYRAKLSKMLKDLSGREERESGRLESDVAAFAKNCDVAEEVTRLEHHINACAAALKKTGGADVGKKLDFIAQEMHREANTICSKSADFRVSRAAIDIKSEIERIREQVNNIE